MAVVWSYPVQPFDTAAGTAVTAAALTAGTPVPPPVSPPIQLAGTAIRITANGEITSTSATPTCALGFYLGAVGGAIGSAAVLGVTAGLAISASATAWPFMMKYEGTFRALSTSSGGNGVVHGQGYVLWWGNVGLTGTATPNPLPVTAAARTVSTINTNTNLQWDVGVTLSVTTGTPSVTITDFTVELLG
jgi:hypothetical protein